MRLSILQLCTALLFDVCSSLLAEDSRRILLTLKTTGCDHSCVIFSDGKKCPASILVNGRERSKRKDGFNVAIIDNYSGNVNTAHFRWFSKMSIIEWKIFRDYFKKIRVSSTVVVVFQNMCKFFDSKWFTLLSSHAGIEISHIIRSQYNYNAAILVGCKYGCPKIIEGQIPFTYFGIRTQFTLKTIEFELNNECSLPRDLGGCQENLKRFYYDKLLNKCRDFVYGGCRGNENNFKEVKDCIKRCVTEDARRKKMEEMKGGIGGLLGGIITVICIIGVIVIILNVYKHRSGEIDWQYLVAFCTRDNEAMIARYNASAPESRAEQNNTSDEHIYECVGPGMRERARGRDVVRDTENGYYSLSTEDIATYSSPAEVATLDSAVNKVKLPEDYNHLSCERLQETFDELKPAPSDATYDSLSKDEPIYEPLAEDSIPEVVYEALSEKDPKV